MRITGLFLFGLLLWQTAAPAQTIHDNTLLGPSTVGRSAKTGVIGSDSETNAPSYAPLTRSERWRLYFMSTYGPGAILRAAAGSGISQWENTPKEWKQGSEAYGERFGNAFAEHIVRKTMESGAAAILHEDNRYFKSTETGFGKRMKHAVTSVLVARNEAGGEHFAYSRIGAAAGASFISREWQPPSETKSGDAAVNFGITTAIDAGWNVFKEFRPKRLGRRL